jgi:hypothetical protein
MEDANLRRCTVLKNLTPNFFCVARRIDDKQKFLVARVNNVVKSLHDPLIEDSIVELLHYDESNDAQKCLAHSTAHTLVSRF